MDEADAIDQLLRCEHWVIVGLRDDATRPAWRVARFLQEQGKSIYPVHPRPEPVHTTPGFATVGDACDAIKAVHGRAALTDTVVDCFVNSERVGAVVDDAIGVGVSGVWMQLGVINEEAAGRARAAGLLAVMDRCPAIELPLRSF